jgi:large subunit ribosomal protein L17
MRHLSPSRKFDRTGAHRKAMFANMVCSLIKEERITTTVQKAKECRRVAEHMITLGKKGTLHARRLAQSTVHDGDALSKLFSELGKRYASRAGGYTRIVRIGRRRGDAASIAVLELVDRVAKPKPEKEEKAKAEKEAD